MYNNYSLGKRLLALLLSAVLVLGMFPVNQVSAAETDAPKVFSFATANPAAIQYEENAKYTNTASGGEGNGAVTYALLKDAGSENPTAVQKTDVAEINQATGELSILKAGKVTVQAKKAADEEAGAPEQTAVYTLVINQPPFGFKEAAPAALSYAADLTYTNPAIGGEGAGKVEYALLEEVEVEPEDPEEPSENPEDPSENPEDPSENPEDPSEDPENPSEDPEEPSENPEDPSENPEDPSENPEDPSEDPEEPGNTPEKPKTEIVEVNENDYAKINPKTGELTIKHAGKVTVRATKAADGEIEKQVAEYTLQIDKGQQPGFGFAETETGVVYSPTEKYTFVPEGGAGEGTAITYQFTKSEHEEFAEIDAKTGELTTLKPGGVIILATKEGDKDYLPATAECTVWIGKANQTGFDFTVANPETMVYNPDDNTFTNVAEGGEVADGVVTYTVVEGSDVAEIDSATGELTILKTGTVKVKATKAGNTWYLDAEDEYTLTVTKTLQAGFAFKDPNPAALDYQAGLIFENEAEGGQSSGAVTYAIVADESTADAAIDSATGKLTISSYGTVTVKATKAGDDDYEPAEATYTLTINGKEQAPLTFAKPNPEMVEFTGIGMVFENPASGGSGNGAITYAIEEGSEIASLGANGNLIIRSEGTVKVVATKAGDKEYNPTSASYTLQVGKSQNAFGFANADVTITYSKDLTYQQEATGGSGNGIVTYSIRNQDLNVATINPATGELTIKTAGTVVVTASKAASWPYAARSASYTLTIEKAEQTGFGFEKDKVTVTYGDNNNRFVLNAAGGESTATKIAYTLEENTKVVRLVENSNNELEILKAGTVKITAVKAGDACYKDSAPAVLTLEVEKAAQTVKFDEENVTAIYGLAEYTKTASCEEPCNDQAIVYSIEGDNTANATIDPATGKLDLTESDVGSVTVKATKPGDDCYEEDSDTYTLTLEYAEIPAGRCTVSGPKANPDSVWFTGDVTISAPEGYEINTTRYRWDPNWANSITYTAEGKNMSTTVYLKKGREITKGIEINGLYIDKTKPVSLNIKYEDAKWYEMLGSIFGFSQKTVKVTFTAKEVDSGSGIGMMEYSVDGGDTFVELKKQKAGYTTSIAAQYRDQVVLRVTDNAGNVITTLDDANADNDGRTLVVDDIPPVIETVLAGTYVRNEADGIYYANKGDFTIDFTVEDANYDLREANPVVKVNNAEQNLGWTSGKTEEGMRYGNATLSLPTEGHYEITADFADRSGNKAEQFKTLVYVDMTKPVRNVTFTDPSRIVDADMKDKEGKNFAEGDDIIAYYNKDAAATIVITEKNFVPGDVVVTVNGEAVKGLKWAKEKNSDNWKTTVSFAEDGEYILAVTYTDRAQNMMDAYESQRIVIDKTLPEVSVDYAVEEAVNTIDDRAYFGETQTATITIKEHNFRADDVKILVTAKDVLGNDVLTDDVKAFADLGINRSAWTGEGDTHVLTLEFAKDANYTFDVEYTDLATNQAADYTEDLFTVDKMAPTNVTIQYGEPVLEETLEDGITYLYFAKQAEVTVTAEDATSGVHHFDYSCIKAENVSDVNVELLDQTTAAETEDTKGTATFKFPAEKEQFNGTLSVTAVDRSGNGEVCKDTRRIIVDSKAPVVDVQYSEKVKSENGVDYHGRNITGTISITEANFFAEDVKVTATKNGEAYPVTVEWEDKSADEHVGTFKFTEEGHYVVTISYQDKSGNIMQDKSGNTVETYVSQELVLDKSNPENVSIIYEETEKNPSKFQERFGKLLKDVFYYNAATTVKLTATDANAGMEGIKLNVNLNGSEGATTIKLPKDLMILANGKTEGETGGIQVIKVEYDEDTGKMTATCKIPKEFRSALEIVAVNMSQKTTTYTDDTVVVVDTIDPTRTVSYTPNRAVDIATMKDVDKKSVKEGDEVVLYYRQDAVVTFKVTEANFHAEDVKVAVNGKSVKITDWTNEGDIWTGTYTLEKEGDYVVTATYVDRARNKMIPYESQRIVVDKTAPVVVTEYSNKDVKNTIGGRDYLDDKQTVTITIKEHNFRADDVRVKVSAKNAAGADVLKLNKNGTAVASYENKGMDSTAWTAYTEGTWRNEDDTYVLTLSFAKDANYTFDVEYEDLATNKIANYKADAFTVDTKAPTGLKVSYSQSVLETVLNAITFGFYRERVTVTIKASDETSGIHNFVYSYTNAPGVSGVNAQLVNQKVQASGSNGEGTATFTIPKDALRSNNQFNGNVSFTAYDRSENSSEMADSKRIVVDNISPDATVEYNAYSRKVEDVTYYDDEITCTIEIDEANFYSEDVKVTVTKDGKEIDVNVAWTRDSADISTGIFTLKEDGEYTISVEYTDKSGNKMESYVSEKHVLDKTYPTVTVSNIKANSANKDEEYGFVIEVFDINLDVEALEPVLTAVLKDENGVYTVTEIDLGDPVVVEEGERYTFTVDNLTEDALYTLTCSMKDLAGNNTVQMVLDDGEAYEKVEFSINRNGSTFGYGNEFTEKLMDQYYVYSVEEDVVIVEVNVDPIENYVVKLNGEELKEGEDYISTQTSNEGEWSRRVYYIDKDLFEAEGEYNIVVSTVDKAETTAFSDVKNLNVAFVVDQTKPVVTITGLEEGGRYQTNEQTVVLIPTDEGGRLNSLRVIVLDSDGNPLKNEFGTDISVRFEMSGEEFLKYLEENDGKVTFTVPEGLNNQVQIICNDCAVNAEGQTNEYNELFVRVTVSQNKMVIFIANRPLFYGCIAGVLGLLWWLFFILFKRKKDDEEE